MYSNTHNGGIYLIYCEAERVAYIGSSACIKVRWARHRISLNRKEHDARRLQAVFNRHGFEGLRFVVLEHCAEKYLLKTEGLYLLVAGMIDGLTMANKNKSYSRSLGRIDGRPVRERLERLIEVLSNYQTA